MALWPAAHERPHLQVGYMAAPTSRCKRLEEIIGGRGVSIILEGLHRRAVRISIPDIRGDLAIKVRRPGIERIPNPSSKDKGAREQGMNIEVERDACHDDRYQDCRVHGSPDCVTVA